jgi:hypothetical protein
MRSLFALTLVASAAMTAYTQVSTDLPPY